MNTASEPQEDLTGLRDRLLEAALPHVALDGWNPEAAMAGAAGIGLTAGDVHAAFSNPGHDLLAHFPGWVDRRMLVALQDLDLPSMKVRERIRTAVQVRFEEMSEHKEASRRAFQTLALPHNGRLAARSLFRTADAVWRAAGDTAVDFSFYSKRGLLAAVLTATTLRWLTDTSPDHTETWAFLDRRIADVMRIPACRSGLQRRIDALMWPRGLHKLFRSP